MTINVSPCMRHYGVSDHDQHQVNLRVQLATIYLKMGHWKLKLLKDRHPISALLTFLWLQWAISLPSPKVFQAEILPKFYGKGELMTADPRGPLDPVQKMTYHLQAERYCCTKVCHPVASLCILSLSSLLFICLKVF